MILVVAVVIWLALSVPIALLLGRLLANGRRNDPRHISTEDQRATSSGRTRSR
jgi:hypothetical protein